MDKFFDWMEKHFIWIAVIGGIFSLAFFSFLAWGLIELIAFLRRH